jgi:hypothetical protein
MRRGRAGFTIGPARGDRHHWHVVTRGVRAVSGDAEKHGAVQTDILKRLVVERRE